MNEIILVDKIEKRLREKREPSVFPLTPTHRKELRNLRSTNIGNLRDRLNTIKTLKRETFEKKYFKQIEITLKKYDGMAEKLNDDWKVLIKKINKLIDERKEFEKTFNINKFFLSRDYNKIAELEKYNTKREFSFEKKRKSIEIASEQFDKKYGKAFETVSLKIDDIYTKYEEAINFGDLEIVKELYYIMKTADNFFINISNLKI